MLNNIKIFVNNVWELDQSVITILFLISILFSILVIISKNPIISVLFLIGLFLSISYYLVLLNFYFLGFSYILVYIGAVSILFLFILMLINVRVSELLSETYNSVFLVIIIAFLFGIVINEIIPNSMQSIQDLNQSGFYVASTDNINKVFGFIKIKDNLLVDYISFEWWDNSLKDISHINGIGNIMYTNYSIWIIVISILLLLSMVGCIVTTTR